MRKWTNRDYRGSVKVSIGDVVVDIVGSGAVIGEMAVLAGVPRTATVVATRVCRPSG